MENKEKIGIIFKFEWSLENGSHESISVWVEPFINIYKFLVSHEIKKQRKIGFSSDECNVFDVLKFPNSQI